MNVRNSQFNVLKFLVIFLILLEGFYAYVGITTKDGKLFSLFLNKYANFPEWVCIGVIGIAKLLLKAAGFVTYQRDVTTLAIEGSGGVNLAWGCLGAGAISLWIAFIAAHKCNFRFKLKWTSAGIIFIFIVNAIRVAMIVLSNHYRWTYLVDFDAHSSFNALTYLIILGLMWIFARRYKHLIHSVKKV